MAKKTMMQRRGHHICQMVNYQVRQQITPPSIRKWGGNSETTPGSIEVMIYKSKKKIEGGMKSIEYAVKKVYKILKKENTTLYLSKKLIKRYNLS